MSVDVVRMEVAGRWAGQPHGRFAGRALQSEVYKQLDAYEERQVLTSSRTVRSAAGPLHATPSATEAIHELDSVKPVTAALIPGPEGETLVLTGYGPCAAPVMEVRHRFPGALVLDGHPWLGGAPTTAATTWDALLTRAAPAVSVRFEFDSPASFHHSDQDLPFPLPSTLFGGLRARWEQWGGPPLLATPGDLESRVAVARFEGRSAAVQLQGQVRGFLGTVDFVLRSDDEEAGRAFAALTAFAPFAGAGRKVGMGLGSVRTRILREWTGRLRR